MLDAEKTALGYALKCAHCGNTNLHHDEVFVFERRDDAQQGTRVMVAGVDQQAQHIGAARFPYVTFDVAMVGNPSARRQGVHVGLWCELCGQRSALSIAQHKGETYLECRRAFVNDSADLHNKLLSFILDKCACEAGRQLLGVDLLYAPGDGFKDEEIRKWIRADESELFDECRVEQLEKFVSQIVELAEGEVDAKASSDKHRFIVRTHQAMVGRATHTFTLSREATGS